MADNSTEARERAKARFKQAEERRIDGGRAWAEHLSRGKAVGDKTARVRSARLARDANQPDGCPNPASTGPKKPSRGGRSE